MTRWPDRIPDGIEPIVGYRMWGYTSAGGRVELHSLRCMTPAGGCPWEAVASHWVVASCEILLALKGLIGELEKERFRTAHEVPGDECQCGFYAMSSLRGLLAEADPRYLHHEGAVLGRVALAGKVIEHEHGYRAERARILELIPIQGTEVSVKRLGDLLALPVGRSVPLFPEGPRPSSPAARVRISLPWAAVVAWLLLVTGMTFYLSVTGAAP
jgi:hypothetical protein